MHGVQVAVCCFVHQCTSVSPDCEVPVLWGVEPAEVHTTQSGVAHVVRFTVLDQSVAHATDFLLDSPESAWIGITNDGEGLLRPLNKRLLATVWGEQVEDLYAVNGAG